MRLRIHLHQSELSLLDTASALVTLGVDRCRAALHNWMQKADLQPAGGARPGQDALGETVIQLDDEQYWLYTAVDSPTSSLLHVKLSPTRTIAITSMFLAELREKHRVDDAVYFVDSARWLQAALDRHGLRFRYERHGNRNAVERVFRKVKRRTLSYSNTFSHAAPATVESWLQTFAVCHNALN